MELANRDGQQVTIPVGTGYFDTTNYPIGGNFRRAQEDFTVTIQRGFHPYKGCNFEGVAQDGRKVAFNYENTAEGIAQHKLLLETIFGSDETR